MPTSSLACVRPDWLSYHSQCALIQHCIRADLHDHHHHHHPVLHCPATLQAGTESAQAPQLYTVLEQRKATVGAGLMGTDHVYVMPGADGTATAAGKRRCAEPTAAADAGIKLVWGIVFLLAGYARGCEGFDPMVAGVSHLECVGLQLSLWGACEPMSREELTPKHETCSKLFCFQA